MYSWDGDGKQINGCGVVSNLEIPLGKRTLKYRFFEILPGLMSYLMIILLFVISAIDARLGAMYLLLIITTTLVKAVGVAYRIVQGYRAVKRAERVDWAKRLEELGRPHENYEKLRGEVRREWGKECREEGRCSKRDVVSSDWLSRMTKMGGWKKREFREKEHLMNLKMLALAKEGEIEMKTIKTDEIYHAVIMVAYNEGLETLIPSVEAVRDTTFPNERIIFMLGYEERGEEEMEKNAKELKRRFEGVFKEFVIVQHPANLRGEIQGKGPNLTYAGRELAKLVEKRKIPSEQVIVTSLDSDNRVSKHYFDYVAYEFSVNENRQRLSYQPVSLFMNNIWDAPAPMRVIAVSNSFFNVISSMRPHSLRNFASHSQPLTALIQMDFWSKRTIVEDGHQYWRSLFHFKGDYEVVPIHVPIYQDAVIEETLIKTLKAQFIQLRRWDYGASDVAYVGSRLFSRKRGMAFWPLMMKFARLLDGHVTLAAMSPIVAFGGWVPRLMNFQSKQLLTYNLPNTVSIIQMIASFGLMLMILLSLKMLPPRPEKYRKGKGIMMILQWVLMPVIAIVYQSFCAFYSQTRLMFGWYMEKFDVTRKVVKK